MDFIEVTISNWSRYNPRKDFKSPRWFAMSNRILEDAQIYALSSDEFKAWVYVLCQASQANSSRIKLYFTHCSRACGVSKRSLTDVIHKMELAESIQVQVRDTNVERTSHNTTLHNRTETTSLAQSGDFASFWAQVPRKIGKAKAAKGYWREIKSGVNHDTLMLHLCRFKAFHQKSKTEAKFIPHASTFVNNHSDWADELHGQSEDFSISAKPDLSDIFRKVASRD